MYRLLPFSKAKKSLIFHFSLADFDPVELISWHSWHNLGTVGIKSAVLVQQFKRRLDKLNEDGLGVSHLPFFFLSFLFKKVIRANACASLFYTINSNHGFGFLSLAIASGSLALLQPLQAHFRVNAAITGRR